MKIGAVFPQTEFGNDPVALRDYAQTLEGLGYHHVLAYDHVLGANPNRPGGWNGPYTYQTPFHEPFVLFSFMAGVTTRLEFATGIIILPQRQTALVAKQAATLDVLSGGRLRLGIGIGWNQVEYECLNENFHNRGRRVEEQVEVLRLLWTQPLVQFKGRWHSIPDAGINPLPIQQPIPIWFGGHAEAVMRRIARWGAGWMPNYRRVEEARPNLELLEQFLAETGRSRDEVGLEPRLAYGDGNPDRWRQWMEEWQAVGATHMTVNTMGCGFATPAEHMAALERFARETGLRPPASP
ncbi:LLM class F420-dependent oxidoreductase [Litorilinea aerophila]|uniref:LLM class F420-dependent oxidoreductase n=1 Tax=Litorilinea aerophila TaxID=1204385 RepID=A0A540VDC0_9CHLR|nr:LLM class F420-dependent oxidoreductase [Litorilinea aerophila]MCC9078129.1 LLM class F420-dependent oxidoreductase [Litorilinea aerophila]OUC08290.1 luciferase [Litorilinea aerophila]